MSRLDHQFFTKATEKILQYASGHEPLQIKRLYSSDLLQGEQKFAPKVIEGMELIIDKSSGGAFMLTPVDSSIRFTYEYAKYEERVLRVKLTSRQLEDLISEMDNYSYEKMDALLLAISKKMKTSLPEVVRASPHCEIQLAPPGLSYDKSMFRVDDDGDTLEFRAYYSYVLEEGRRF